MFEWTIPPAETQPSAETAKDEAGPSPQKGTNPKIVKVKVEKSVKSDKIHVDPAQKAPAVKTRKSVNVKAVKVKTEKEDTQDVRSASEINPEP